MKIIVNKCYGGWGLSNVAIKRFLELQGKECFFYKQTKYKHDGGIEEYVKVNEMDEKSFSVYSCTEDLGDVINNFPSKAHVYINSDYRIDPLLIQTLEELGEDVCSASLAKLKIVEIPDGISWEIDEYDGIESVHETHRSW